MEKLDFLVRRKTRKLVSGKDVGGSGDPLRISMIYLQTLTVVNFPLQSLREDVD